MRKELAEKDAEIQRLQSIADTNAAYGIDAERQLAEKDAEIAEIIKAGDMDNEALDLNLRRIIAEKDAEIERLRTALEMLIAWVDYTVDTAIEGELLERIDFAREAIKDE